MPDPRHALGERAEDAAARWLLRRGWTILARRWRCAAGELDLVARDPELVLVAVEVKVRRTGRAGSPSESIEWRRLRRLRAGLAQFVAETRTPIPAGLRLDLVGLREGDDGRWLLSHQRGIDAW